MSLSRGNDGSIEFSMDTPPEYLLKKGVHNPEFPYKKIVSCPHCNRTLLGSASRGRLGKYYPAYHCSNHGHYFRVPQKEFDETILSFVRSLSVSQDRADDLIEAVSKVWEARKQQVQQDEVTIQTRIDSLQTQARLIVDKMKYLTSETAIKYMEEDLMKIEEQIKELVETSKQIPAEKRVNMKNILLYVKYFMEHLDDLLINPSDPVNRAAYFGVLFNKVPTYQQIKDGTLKIAQTPGVNELFTLAQGPKGLLAGAPGRLPNLLWCNIGS